MGWLLAKGSTKSQTQTSPSAEAARMLRTRKPDRVRQCAETAGQLGRISGVERSGQH